MDHITVQNLEDIYFTSNNILFKFNELLDSMPWLGTYVTSV